MDFIRVNKDEIGWVVEYKYPTWTLFGIKYKWTHYISITGISDHPWYFKSKEMAIKETLKLIKNRISFKN